MWMAEFRNLDVEFLDTTELINMPEKHYSVSTVALGPIQEGVSYIS